MPHTLLIVFIAISGDIRDISTRGIIAAGPSEGCIKEEVSLKLLKD